MTNEAAINEVRNTFANRITALEAVLDSNPTGYVYCWAKYGLGVKLSNNGPLTRGIENATVFRKSEMGIWPKNGFRNGADEPAVLMPRRKAIEAAIKTVSESAAHFERALAKV
jgi:hypothetical protein